MNLTLHLGAENIGRLPRAGGATGSTPFFAFPEGRTIRLVHDDCALSRTPWITVKTELLLAFGRGADDHQQALRGLLEPGLHMDAVDPDRQT